MMKQINRLAIILGLLPAVLSAQYTQHFDAFFPFPPQGWTLIDGGDQSGWRGTSGGHDSSGFAVDLIGTQGEAHDDYLVSPAITITPGISDKLSFWAMNGISLPAYMDDFSVKISTTTPTKAAFTDTLATGITPSGNVWTQYTYDLSTYAGQTIYIAFYSSSQDKYLVEIDDFEVSGNVLGVSDVSKNTARIYPNPVQDVLHIEGKNKISQISIYDVSGRLQQKEDVNSNVARINVQKLMKGNYIVKIKEGSDEKTYKIIKK